MSGVLFVSNSQLLRRGSRIVKAVKSNLRSQCMSVHPRMARDWNSHFTGAVIDAPSQSGWDRFRHSSGRGRPSGPCLRETK